MVDAGAKLARPLAPIAGRSARSESVLLDSFESTGQNAEMQK